MVLRGSEVARSDLSYFTHTTDRLTDGSTSAQNGHDGRRPPRWAATGAVKLSARNKPSSVPLSRGGSFIWDCCHQQPHAAYPGLEWSGQLRRPLFGLATGGVYHATSVTSGPVRSYRTISPLPVPRTAIGGVFSAALSVVSRRPGVTRHPALRSSDFPPTDESDGDPHSPRSPRR